MNATPPSLASVPRLLAVSLLCALPAVCHAQQQPPVVIFRNECRVPVTVQTAVIVNGNAMREQPMLVRPGEYCKFKADVDKVVVIYDTKSNQMLFRDTLKVPKSDLGYGIQPDPKVPNKVILIPRKPDTKD